MTRFAAWLLLLVVFGLFGGVAVYALQAQAAAGKGMPPYSVYGEDRNGLAAAARLLRQLGWEPVALTRPVDQLSPSPVGPQLLFLVEPQPGAMLDDGVLSERDARSLVRWVERGHTLVLCGRQGTALHRELGVGLHSNAEAARDETPREVVLGEAGAYTDNIDRLIVEGNDAIDAPQGLPLWWLDNRPGAVLLRRGQGRVLVVPDPSWLTRRGLGRQRLDNAVFLVRLAELHAGDGRVYFDEYHHNIRSGGGFWAYLHYHGQLWVLLTVLAATAVAGWALMVRLGPAVAQPPEVRADAVDYASALARIYERAGVCHLLGRGVARDFQAALARHLRMRRNALPAEILAAWRLRSAREAAQVEELLRGVAELRRGAVPPGRLLSWVRTFDRFKESMAARG